MLPRDPESRGGSVARSLVVPRRRDLLGRRRRLAWILARPAGFQSIAANFESTAALVLKPVAIAARGCSSAKAVVPAALVLEPFVALAEPPRPFGVGPPIDANPVSALRSAVAPVADSFTVRTPIVSTAAR